MKSNGFTIIELIIYSGITCIILIVFSFSVWRIVGGNVKAGAFEEVEQNATFAMEKIAKAVRNAASVITPANTGDVSFFLELEMQDVQKSPTVFEVSGNRVTVQEGAGGVFPLTTDRVQATNLQFTNLSYDNTPGVVKIELTIEHLNPSQRNEYEATTSLASTASLRK